MLSKASMVIKGRTQSGTDSSQTISNINIEKLSSTDAAVVEAFKADCRNFAIAINSLTTNTLYTVTLEMSEVI